MEMDSPSAGTLRLVGDVLRVAWHKTVPLMRFRGCFAEAPDWWEDEPTGIGQGQLRPGPVATGSPGLAVLCPVRVRARFVNSSRRAVESTATVTYLDGGQVTNSIRGAWVPQSDKVELRPNESGDLILAVGLGEQGFLIQNHPENCPPSTEVDGAALDNGSYLFGGMDLALGQAAFVRVILEHTFGTQAFYFRLKMAAQNIPDATRVGRLAALRERFSSSPQRDRRRSIGDP